MGFARVIETVSTLLKERNHAFAVIGGFAVAKYGRVRTALDVGLVTSSDDCEAFDFERDIPTTPADVEALRAPRPKARSADLKDLDRLRPPEGFRERDGLRKPFGDWPPFEL